MFEPESYVEHKLWLDLPLSYRYTAIVFQIFAIVGFIRMFIYFMYSKPERGILSYYKGHMLWIILLFFLVASVIWPFATYYKQHTLVVISLLVAGIACTLLLAGCTEDRVPVDVMLSAFVLCIVCVLQDAVMWNSAYILLDK